MPTRPTILSPSPMSWCQKTTQFHPKYASHRIMRPKTRNVRPCDRLRFDTPKLLFIALSFQRKEGKDEIFPNMLVWRVPKILQSMKFMIASQAIAVRCAGVARNWLAGPTLFLIANPIAPTFQPRIPKQSHSKDPGPRLSRHRPGQLLLHWRSVG